MVASTDFNRRPLAIDLFAGCGGLSLGLEASGFDVVAGVERDPVHALVHHFNFPYGVTFCRDIRDISSTEILQKITQKGFQTDIDLVAGGSPCQGFSLMGKRHLKDPRNQLIFEYVRLIAEIKPKYFIFENVPGMLTGKHQSFLKKLLRRFKKVGYKVVKPRILEASDYGIPQKRKRLILLGYRQDLPPLFYPPTVANQQTLETDQTVTTVYQAIQDLSCHQPYFKTDDGLDPNQLDYTQARTSYNIIPAGAFQSCHLRSHTAKIWGHLASQHLERTQLRFAQTLPGTTEKISHFHKLTPDGLCHTLRAGTASDKGAHTAPRPIHYQHPRCITLREGGRLHSYPDWFQFHRTIWHGFREIGNSVPPLLGKALGETVIKALTLQPNSFPQYQLEPISETMLKCNPTQASRFWQEFSE